MVCLLFVHLAINLSYFMFSFLTAMFCSHLAAHRRTSLNSFSVPILCAGNQLIVLSAFFRPAIYLVPILTLQKKLWNISTLLTAFILNWNLKIAEDFQNDKEPPLELAFSILFITKSLARQPILSFTQDKYRPCRVFLPKISRPF